VQSFLVEIDDPIAPFGEPARLASIGGAPLALFTADNLQRLGLTSSVVRGVDQVPASAAPLLILHDDLFVTRRALRSFLRRAQQLGGARRLALPDGLLMQRYHPLQRLARDDQGRWLFDAWFVDASALQAAGSVAAAIRTAQPLAPEYKEQRLRVPVPRHIVGNDGYEHPVTTTIALRIRHWVHILWANNLLPQTRLVERITEQPLATLWRLLGSAGLSRHAMKQRAFRRFNYLGRNCRIHPTARLEYSVLGDNVEVGAFALVRGSLIGSNTVIEERCDIAHSTIGPDNFVSRNSVLIMCASYDDADVCVDGMQFALCGRRCALTSYVRPLDMNFRAPASVLDDGQPVALPGHMLGPCFGHDTFVGPDITIRPGRAIPNGTVLLPPPENALSRVPADWPAGQPGVVRDGVLQPLAPRGKG
jgi:acetyltransferase-like isoleucine patch superfamily enzyme